jgi:hypothetical protein
VTRAPHPSAAYLAERERQRREVEPYEQEFEVVGERPVEGKAKGERVVLTITLSAANALVAGGHVKRVTESDVEEAADPQSDEEEDPQADSATE